MFADPFEAACERTFGRGGYLDRWFLFAHLEAMFREEERKYPDREFMAFLAKTAIDIQLRRLDMGIPSVLA